MTELNLRDPEQLETWCYKRKEQRWELYKPIDQFDEETETELKNAGFNDIEAKRLTRHGFGRGSNNQIRNKLLKEMKAKKD